MSRPKQSDLNLIKLTEDHLLYEIKMLNYTARSISSEIVQSNNVLKCSLIESFCIHVRTLLKFFFDSKPFITDAVAGDFYKHEKEWIKIRESITSNHEIEELFRINERVNKEIAHLTYDRLNVKPEHKGWGSDGKTAYDILRSAYIEFLRTVSEELICEECLQDKHRLLPTENS